MLTRRDFLQASSVVALAPSVPSLLRRTARAAEGGNNERLLVVVQLSGGNDGINTVVPFADDGYKRHRKELRLPGDRLLPLNDSLALHPSMQGAMDLLEEGRLAIVQGVGYPNPSRSHPVSMATWQSARLDREEHRSYGWIGRGLDAAPNLRPNVAGSVLVGDEPTPLTLRARKTASASLRSIEEMLSFNESGRSLAAATGDTNDLSAFVQRQSLDAYATADLLRSLARPEGQTASSYPSTALAGRLKLIAQLIKADLGSRVYYATQPGYDTHSQQLPRHSRLLRQLAGALKAFVGDLHTAGLGERVLVLCFSEFGRRVAENASIGTDHGTAGPVLLAGSPVQPGVHGQTPALADLAGDEDPEYTVDFRSVYASILERWLGIDSTLALAAEFPQLPLLR